MSDNRFLPIAKIISAHGIKGHVKISHFLFDSSNLLKYGKIFDHSGNIVKIKLLGQKPPNLIVQIADINDRDAAEGIQGEFLYIEKAQLPEIKSANSFYYIDLIGLQLINKVGDEIGQIINVDNFGAGDVIEIRLLNGKIEMLPFNNDTFPQINITEKYAIVDLPDIVIAKEK